MRSDEYWRLRSRVNYFLELHPEIEAHRDALISLIGQDSEWTAYISYIESRKSDAE